MAAEKMYRQCTLEKRHSPTSCSTRTFWTEDKDLFVGRVVTVEEHDGLESPGWEIKQIYDQRLPERAIVKARHAHTRQRAASDI